jgi:hypothetical protein
MRTTLTIDDDVLDRLKREARRSRRPLKAVVNDALRSGVDQMRPPVRRSTFTQQAFPMGVPPTSSFDKALQLAARLEDEETLRKLALGR